MKPSALKYIEAVDRALLKLGSGRTTVNPKLTLEQFKMKLGIRKADTTHDIALETRLSKAVKSAEKSGKKAEESQEDPLLKGLLDASLPIKKPFKKGTQQTKAG